MRCCIVLVLVALLSACDPVEPAAKDDGSPRVELGIGQLAFQPLRDGDTIELVHGLQGGWHLDLSARFAHVAPQAFTITYTATRRSDGELISFDARYAVKARRLQRDDAGGLLRLGDRVVLNIDAPSEVVDEDLDIEIVARGDAGAELTLQRIITVVDLQ